MKYLKVAIFLLDFGKKLLYDNFRDENTHVRGTYLNYSTKLTSSQVFGHYNCQVRPSVRTYILKNKKITTTSKVNNSAIFQHRPVPRVANERYCYIFFIFRVIWGEGVKG